ncbi:MAG: C25 family cysteine peptidase, partial [Bacteroidales bacterium]
MRVTHKAIVLLAGFLLLSGGHAANAQVHDGRASGDRTGAKPARPVPDLSYRSGDPRFRQITDPSGRYLRMIIPGHHQTSVTGMPELPVYSRLVEVPEGMDIAVSLSGISSRRIRLSEQGAGDAELFPAQPARTKNEPQDEKVVFKDKKTYASRGIISHDTVVISYEGIHRGRRLANIAVYPAFYDPRGGYIDLITAMEMDIRFDPSMSKGDEEDPTKNEKGGYASDAYVPGYSENPIQMIIVTDSAFTGHLAPLLKWKMLKGIRTTLICRKPGPADTVYHDLKKRITAVYLNSVAAGNPVQYLLIAGDPAIIPTARVTTNVSDMYYGEFDGEGDYIPELFIGRLPVSDTTQLKGMVKKIIDYEKWNYLPADDFWSGAVATAGNAPGFEIYMNSQVNYVYSNYLSGDTSLKAFRWLYPEAQLKDDSLKLLFNKGLAILNYTGHGEAAGFSDPQFRASMVTDLTNTDEYPLIIANACRTAQINVTPCFGTSMVNAAGKGAIGYIGCTNDSYWVDDFFWAVGPG